MIASIYKSALGVIAKKPFVLWGISLLQILLVSLATFLFGAIPGLAICITLLLGTGMTLIFLYGYRGQDVHCVQLFDCFTSWARIKRVLGGMAWMLLWIFLWSLIPVVGVIFAIIRTYEYRLTPYILVFEPEVPITEAIKVSKQRTRGWKGQMFGADVLIVLGLFVAYLILSLLAMIPLLGILFGLVAFLLVLAETLFLPLFLGLVQAAFYDKINEAGAASATTTCAACNAAIPASSVFCPQCGAAQNQQ